MGDEQTIATTSTALNLGDISGIKALYVRNLDATNFVQIDSNNGFANFPQKLYPGDAILLLPQTTTIYAKADTAPVKIWIVAG